MQSGQIGNNTSGAFLHRSDGGFTMLKRKLNYYSKRKGEIGQGIGQTKKTFITRVFMILYMKRANREIKCENYNI